MPLLCHHLLRLGQPLFAPALHMPDLHVRVVMTGNDPHKGDPVAVIFVHVRLNLEHES